MAPKVKSLARSELSDSWVVNLDYHDEAASNSTGQEPQPAISKAPSKASRKKQIHHSSLAASEPELIMPSIYEGEVEGSPWSTPARKPSNRPDVAKAPPAPANPPVQTRTDTTATDRRRNTPSLSETIFNILRLPAIDFSHGVWGFFSSIGPMVTMLVVFCLVIAISQLAGALFGLLRPALSPLCGVPGVSYLTMEACRASPRSATQSSNTELSFGPLIKAQGAFGDVMLNTAKGSQLAAEMEGSEAAFQHLDILLQASDVGSANEFALEMSGIMEEAHLSRTAVEKYALQVDRVTDRLLAKALWTRNRLRERQEEEMQGSAMAKLLKESLPFLYAALTGSPTNENALYMELARTILHATDSLLAETLSLASNLRTFDERHEALQVIAERERLTYSTRHDDETLVTLFTLLSTSLRGSGNDSTLQLLRSTVTCRRRAWNLVTYSILKLGETRIEMKSLDQRQRKMTTSKKGSFTADQIEALSLGVEKLQDAKKQSQELVDSMLGANSERGE